MTATPSSFRDAFWLIAKYKLFVYLACIVVAFIAGTETALSIASSVLIAHMLALGMLANSRFRRLFFRIRNLESDPLDKKVDPNMDGR